MDSYRKDVMKMMHEFLKEHAKGVVDIEVEASEDVIVNNEFRYKMFSREEMNVIKHFILKCIRHKIDMYDVDKVIHDMIKEEIEAAGETCEAPLATKVVSYVCTLDDLLKKLGRRERITSKELSMFLRDAYKEIEITAICYPFIGDDETDDTSSEYFITELENLICMCNVMIKLDVEVTTYYPGYNDKNEPVTKTRGNGAKEITNLRDTLEKIKNKLLNKK